MATQVQHLLLQLSILSTIRRVGQGKYRDSFHISIQGSKEQLKFLQLVGCYGQRGEIIPNLIAALEKIERNPNYDVIPKEAWDLLIKPFMKEKGISQANFAEMMGIAKSSATYRTGISRSRLSKIADVLANEKLKSLTTSDIYWDEIISIESLGIQEVFDATIEGVHNFIANDIVVHNSIEQDADMVAFIYRPEYYQIMEDENGDSLKGVAEIIFAKNRHGATKTIKLKFIDHFAKFADLDDFSMDGIGGFGDDNGDPNIIKLPSKMNDTDDIPF